MGLPVRIVGAILLLAILAAPLSLTRRQDADILARVGAVAGGKIREALPEASAIAGPLMPVRSIDLVPVEERVRLRIQAEQSIDSKGIQVIRGSRPGEVFIRGAVANQAERQIAVSLAESTRGVTSVACELSIVKR